MGTLFVGTEGQGNGKRGKKKKKVHRIEIEANVPAEKLQGGGGESYGTVMVGGRRASRSGRPVHSRRGARPDPRGRWACVEWDSVGSCASPCLLGCLGALLPSRCCVRHDLRDKGVLGNLGLLHAIDWMLELSVAVPDHAALGSHMLGQVDLSVKLVRALAFERQTHGPRRFTTSRYRTTKGGSLVK